MLGGEQGIGETREGTPHVGSGTVGLFRLEGTDRTSSWYIPTWSEMETQLARQFFQVQHSPQNVRTQPPALQTPDGSLYVLTISVSTHFHP